MPANLQNLILIPARSGSTRVENKNLKLLGGKPLVVHAIQNALSADCARVICSTNSPEIAEAAKKAGMKTLLEDGIEKVFMGATTLEEVLKEAQTAIL